LGPDGPNYTILDLKSIFFSFAINLKRTSSLKSQVKKKKKARKMQQADLAEELQGGQDYVRLV